MCVCVCESIQPLPFLSTLQAPLASHSPLSSICFTLHYRCMPYHSISLSLSFSLDSDVSLSLSVLSLSLSLYCLPVPLLLLPLCFANVISRPPLQSASMRIDWCSVWTEWKILTVYSLLITRGAICRFWWLPGGIMDLKSLINRWRMVSRLTYLACMAWWERLWFPLDVNTKNMPCYLL